MIDQFYQSVTKELTQQDISSILEILDQKDKISKVDKVDNEQLKEIILSALSNDNERIIGYFVNDVLISYLAQYFSKRMPAWHMTMLGTRSKFPWNYKKNGLEYCWANAMDYAEKLDFYRIYWSLPSRWARTQQKTYMTTEVWYRYNIYIEDVIELNNFPKWDEHKISFGKILKPHDVTIKMAVLKNEFRRFSIKI